MAVAVFKTSTIVGDALATPRGSGVVLTARFTTLPPGKHGFHIHVAGDLRGEGCLGACTHFHKGPPSDHGGPPRHGNHTEPRHTGDLGNITTGKFRYFLAGVSVEDLLGRSLIVHADEDDLGLGNSDDSKTTGHSGARIGCSIFGRVKPCSPPSKTRKQKKKKLV